MHESPLSKPSSRQYSPDLTPPWKKSKPAPEVEAVADLVVEEVETGFCGAVVRVEKSPEGFVVTLEDRHGKLRVFPMEPRGFMVDGDTVTLVRPGVWPGGPARPVGGVARGTDNGRPRAAGHGAANPVKTTASGSIAVPNARARVARAGRIYVEGRHDAELVERVWGDDLRIEGVVVEYLEGIDDLPAIVAEFGPGPDARLGVLVDHLVPGSKESRIAAQIKDPDVLIVGHPYIDVWQAVKPASVGIAAWPVVPRGTPWKEGVCAGLGWPADTPAAWKRILGRVRTYRDLEPELLGSVERLIDFVTD